MEKQLKTVYKCMWTQANAEKTHFFKPDGTIRLATTKAELFCQCDKIPVNLKY